MENLIKVKVKECANGHTELYIGETNIATIQKDWKNVGRWAGHFSVFGVCNNKTFPEAVEFITDCIDRHFAQFGIEVSYC